MDIEMEQHSGSGEGWISRITDSATGLAQNFLSPDNGYQTTSDLAALRSAHKAGWQTQNGNACATERHPKLLSSRHKSNGNFRSSRPDSNLLDDDELEGELVDFLSRNCSLGDGHASSSRSASPPSPLSGNEHIAMSGAGGELWAQGDTSYGSAQPTWNKQHSHQKDYQDIAQQRQLAAAIAEREAAQFDTHWTNHLVSEKESNSSLKLEAHHTAPSQEELASKAARRLHLISHHIELVTSKPQPRLRPATLADFNSFESSYHHLATLSQPYQPILSKTPKIANLSDFESSYNHISSLDKTKSLLTPSTPSITNLSALESSYNHIGNLPHHHHRLNSPFLASNPLANLSACESSYTHISNLSHQASLSESTTTATSLIGSSAESTHGQLCPGEMSAEWADFLAQGPYCLTNNKERFYTASAAPQTPSEQSSSSRSAKVSDVQTSSFPRKVLREAVERKLLERERKEKEEVKQKEEEPMPPFRCPWVGCHHYFEQGYQYIRTPSGELEGLACVHVDCDEAFTEEGEWRAHVLGPHHGLQRTPPNEPAVDSAATEGAGVQVDAFEKAWRERNGLA